MADANTQQEWWASFFRDHCRLAENRVDAYATGFAGVEPTALAEIPIYGGNFRQALDNLRMFVHDAHRDELISIRHAAKAVMHVQDVAAHAPPPESARVKAVYKRVKKFVWYTKTAGVNAQGEPVEDGSKRCVTIMSTRYALMAAHCIYEGAPIGAPIRLYNKSEQPEMATLKDIDRDMDYAVIELASGGEFPEAPTQSVPSVGDEYIVVGYPVYETGTDSGAEQLDISVFPGCFMWTSRPHSPPKQAPALQWNYVGVFGTRRGCSGGGVFHMRGHLLGICLSGKDTPVSWAHTGLFEAIYTHLAEPAVSHILPIIRVAERIEMREMFGWPQPPATTVQPSTRVGGDDGGTGSATTRHDDEMPSDDGLDAYFGNLHKVLQAHNYLQPSQGSSLPQMNRVAGSSATDAAEKAQCGKFKLALGDVTGAIAQFYEALKMEPRNVDHHLALSEAFYKLNLYGASKATASMGYKLCKGGGVDDDKRLKAKRLEQRATKSVESSVALANI